MVSPSGENLPAAIGRYQIRTLIGRGGMGEVFGAFDPHLDRHVALKTIQPGQQDASLVARLQLEARAIGRLQHRGIVTIHDLGEADGKLFIAMEWLQGRSLAQAMKSGDLAFGTKLQILVEVLEALSYAHGQGIIHRDIKPSNVWVEPNGHVKLLDFGLARFTQTDGLTMTGDVMGTPLYMSPEQLKGHPVDGRSDVYSCGVTGYELFSRRRPFDGESITAIIIKVLGDTAPPLGTAWSSDLPEIDALIAKAMAKAPDDRFATAEEMAAALRAFVKDHQKDIERIDKEDALGATVIISEVEAMHSPVPRPPAFFSTPKPPSVPPAHTPAPPVIPAPVENPTPIVTRGPIEVPTATAVPTPTAAPAPVVMPVPNETSTRSVIPAPVVIPAPIAEPVAHRTRMHPALLAAAAIVLVGGTWAVAQFTRGNGGQATGGPNPSPVAPAVAPVKESPTPSPAAPPPVTPPETPAPVAAAVPDPAAAASRPSLDNSSGVLQGRPGGRGLGSALGARQARGVPPPPAADLAGFFVDEKTAPALRDLLAAQLRESGLSPGARPVNSRWMITATGEVEIRSAPVGGGSGLTADYSGGVLILDRRSGRTERQSFEGHVLDFGRVVVRTRAERELAEKMSSYITTTIKSWQ